MSTDISKTYEPKEVEEKWYDKWIADGCFKGIADESKEAYSIVIPPPNVTGVLTMGHVLNNTIQDILARRARQQGKSVLWLPGTDHAGIATQTKVERQLREEGLHRRDLGREKFLERAVDWRDKHGGIIIEQLKKLGASCDWDRNVHTLDDDYSKAVLTAFITLYKRGYIYRGKRMVNWCPSSLTALSDEEVIMKPQKSKLYKMKYAIAELPGEFVEISTTRPETIMGDTAVAFHPEDERYQHLIGKHAVRPFPEGKIPFITDKHVDKEFGTGMLKVTPAHDQADFEIGQRHNLEIIDVMTPDGKINDLGGEFAGMDRFKARKLAVEKLEELGLLVEVEQYDNNVGYSERADVVVEPRLSEQWFLKYPRVEEAKKVVSEGQIKFWPQRWEKTYLHWLENIQDWCISRQLWWGHRIPVWYKKGLDRETADFSDDTQVHVSLEGPSDPENWEQDEDVLDTWASSWLWPFATMGWPDEAKMKQQGLRHFYPTSDLVTGPDIIFFWVARMIMAGLEFYGEAPEGRELTADERAERIAFDNVYFTGIIRDIQGRKMSKSLGNSPDPLDLIAEFGADGLRFGIMSVAPKGQDIRFSNDCAAQGRNFCNKLWNACRFRQMSGEMSDNSRLRTIASRVRCGRMDADDHAILTQCATMMDEVSKSLDNYEFNAAIQAIYSFFWNDFCDWYVEVSKAKLDDERTRENCLAIQDLCIRQVLLVLHPFAPFITEELWQTLGYALDGASIQYAEAGTGKTFIAEIDAHGIYLDNAAAESIANLRETVTLIRSLKAQYKVANKRDVKLYAMSDADQRKFLGKQESKLAKIAGVGELEFVKEAPDGAPATVTPLGTLYIDLASSVDVDAERKRLQKELDKLNKVIAGSKAKLSNEAFTSKAPEHIIEGAKAQLAANEDKKAEIEKLLAAL